MKTPVYILLLILCSCTSKSQEHKKLLTIADLKFPLTDEDNDGLMKYPKCYRENLVRNHIRAKGTNILVNPKKTYSCEIRKRFRKESRHKEIDFASWLNKNSSLKDSSIYDSKGNLIQYGRFCFMCGIIVYKYDSLDMLIYHNAGSDAIINYYYHYRFDDETRTLFYADTACNLSSENNVYRYHFDTSGYLMSCEYYNKEISHSQTFEYNKEMEIQVAKHFITIPKGSPYESNLPAIPTLVTSIYYYTNHKLDSIVTYSEKSSVPYWNYSKRTYFDSSELPIKTTYDKVFDKPEYAKTLLYNYSRQ